MPAVEADRVIVALIGDTTGLDRPVEEAARKFDRGMTDIERSATRAERQIVSLSRQNGNAMRNISRQFSDVGVQLGMGQSFFMVMSQQLPQIGDALADTQGRFAKFGQFLTNPWVAAGAAAAAALLPLLDNVLKTGNELDGLVEKMRKQARQAENNRIADERWKQTIEGMTEAIRKRREEQEKALQTDIQTEQASYKGAQKELDTAVRKRAQIEKEIAAGEARLRDLSSSPAANDPRAGFGKQIRALETQLQAKRAELKSLNKLIPEYEASVRATEIPLLERRVENRVDAVARATDRYTIALGKLREERQKGIITARQFEERELAARNRRDREVEEAEKARRKVASPDADTTAFLRPVEGGRTSGKFGERRTGRAHAGIDYAVPVGTSVRAAAPGTVIESGNLPGYGNAVIIDHGRGTITRYAHLSKLLGGKGDRVEAGDIIGLSGGAKGAAGSGNSQGPHLHYEVRRGGKPVNPNGSFPIDPATARQVRDKVQDDFDSLWDDLTKGADQAREKIETDFQQMVNSLDPAAAAADTLAKRLQTIEDARLIGLIDDTKAAQAAFLALNETVLNGVVGSTGAASAIGEGIGEATAKGIEDGIAEAQDAARDSILALADVYETAFEGGTKGLWDLFKREGLRSLAMLAAQQTFRLLGKEVPSGVGGDDLFSSLFAGIFGRASGGYVGPGQTVRVNEHKGGMELLRMGSQGGTVIPLGQARAASPGGRGIILNQTINVDARGVNPTGYAEHIKSEVRKETAAIVAEGHRRTMEAVPQRMQNYDRYGA
jgi:murein DD-endopeptidase MepM/ murein hydrolase activator NlpD